MHWLIKCRSKPGTDALRTATIDAHRDFLDGYPEVTWYSGPLFTDDNKNAIEVVTVADRRRKIVQPGGTSPRYLSSGHLLYTNKSTLFAVPFDFDKLARTVRTANRPSAGPSASSC